MNIDNNNAKEEDNNYKKLNLLNNRDNEFFEAFSEKFFKNLNKEEFNKSKCSLCEQVSLYPKVFIIENYKDKKIICNLNGQHFFENMRLDKEASNILKQIIGNYIVFCLNSKCNWEGKLSKLKNHLINECKFQVMKCPNKGCEMILLKKDLNSHLVQCLYDSDILKINCNFCKNEIKKIDIENHFEICPEVIIECDKKCGKKIKRKDIKSHMSECKENLIKCKYWEYGCKKKIKIKYIQDHENLEIYNHYNLINSRIKNIFDETNEYYYAVDAIKLLEAKIKEREKQVKNKNNEDNKEKEIKKEIVQNLIENDDKRKINDNDENKKWNKDPDDFIGNHFSFFSSNDNSIIKFEEKKIIYNGNDKDNLEIEKYYFAISQVFLDLNSNTEFSFKIEKDAWNDTLPWLAFGLYNIINENWNYFKIFNTFPKKGLYCIDLDSNTCNDGIINNEKNNYRLDINGIIIISFLPKKKYLIIKDHKNSEIIFENIPNNNCDLRICFIFKGNDSAIINYK